MSTERGQTLPRISELERTRQLAMGNGPVNAAFLSNSAGHFQSLLPRQLKRLDS
jgi:hypothetical protein